MQLWCDVDALEMMPRGGERDAKAVELHKQYIGGPGKAKLGISADTRTRATEQLWEVTAKQAGVVDVARAESELQKQAEDSLQMLAFDACPRFLQSSEGNKVVKSLNRGQNMKAISPNITNTDRGAATALSESPRDADIVYVGTDDGALWVTHDGGANWSDCFKMAVKDPTEAEEEPAEGESVGARVVNDASSSSAQSPSWRTCPASSSRGCHSRYSDLTCTIITSVVDSILLAGVGAVAALRKKTRSGAVGRADAGQT